MSRVSKKQSLENREKVVAAASRLFKKRGVRNVGIDDLMAEVGLTRGGFYKMFSSKDQLASEACKSAFDTAEQTWHSLMSGDEPPLISLARYYLAPKAPEQECPMVTLSEDIARLEQNDPQKEAFTKGFKRLTQLSGSKPLAQSDLSAIAALVGARILSRTLNDEALSAALVSAVTEEIASKSR